MRLDDKSDLNSIVSTAIELIKSDNNQILAEVLLNSEILSDMTNFDNWNGGQYYYTLYFNLPIEKFALVKDTIEFIEKSIQSYIEIIIRAEEHLHIEKITITPQRTTKINWDRISNFITRDNLLQQIEFLKDTMISVATGRQMIQSINEKYKQVYLDINIALKKLNIENPNPYGDLWEWYEKWSTDFKSYTERRTFISKMYKVLLDTIHESDITDSFSIEQNIKGWERVERTVNEIKRRINIAKNEEQFQSIGHLCRETLISLAQEVYDKNRYPTLDGVEASKTDAKRMLEAFIMIELGGSINETLRKYARTAIELANELTHKRTASKKDALLCSSATLNLINVIKVIQSE